AIAWAVVPDRLLIVAWTLSAVAGLVLGLVIAFRRISNPAPIAAYAVVEGVFVGLISKYYETAYSGIVLQAVIATFGVFFLMSMLYRARVIRATPKFARGLIACLIGAVALMAINLLLSVFGINTHLRDGSWLAIVFSLAMIVLASLTFILDFNEVEQGVKNGLPQRYAWVCAFGMLVGLIWLYLEILRLLGYLRGND
ncbi:MAG TPA: Bax inhibitor-1/YccA family protein, partial [Micromonosporaceae bacterium]|nr:Bax inhibitor-1/YccA family protein [Micromonosporaceae bacterium]